MNTLTEALPAQFMNYVMQWNVTAGKYDKFPCLPDGTVVNAHEPANWTDHATALAACRADRGVAFVLTADDPWFFLDLDKCRNPDGSWTAEATAMFTSFPGAAGEISVSGEGLHIMGKCNADALRDRKRKWAGWLEFYTEGRFIAFGPEGWAGIGGTWNPDLDWTATLANILPMREAMGDLPDGVDPAYTGPEDDGELIRKMLMSSGGMAAGFGGKATVAQLWNADPILCTVYPDYAGNGDQFDHSSADAALMAHLAFWTGKDMPRMERLFRQSALMRPKFEREDYRRDTITGAARMCTRVYDRPRKSDPKAAPVADPANPAHEVYMTVHEQITHFDSCVYMASDHKVMIPSGKMLKPEQFNAMYGGHIFQMNPDGTQPEKKAFTAFTENRTHKFPKVVMSVFDPKQKPGEIFMDEDDISCVNTYFPAHVDMTPGDVTPFLVHLEKLLPDPKDREILMCWMASAIQNPDVKFQWAPVLQGTEGNGKTFFANCVAYGIGEKFVHRPNPENLTEKHNGWMKQCLLAIVEEIHMGDRYEMLENLKWKITNERIPIRGMAVDEGTFKNYTKWMFCTNHMSAVIVNSNSRRYSIFYTGQQSRADKIRDGMTGSYFPDLYQWARTGGYAAVAHYLKHYAIPERMDPAKLSVDAPHTTSTDKAIEKSLGRIETEILEATEDGTMGFKGGWISAWSLDNLLRSKNIRVSTNRRGEILESLGYIRCPEFTGGRAPKPLVWEDRKRPVIYMRPDTNTGDDPLTAYITAQGYVGMS